MIYSDKDADYSAEYKYNANEMEPIVAKPFNPGNTDLAKNLGDVKLDRAYIGSCTGGKTKFRGGKNTKGKKGSYTKHL